jgi:hypothetical protein
MDAGDTPGWFGGRVIFRQRVEPVFKLKRVFGLVQGKVV